MQYLECEMCFIQERNAVWKSQRVFTTKSEEKSQLKSIGILYLILLNILFCYYPNLIFSSGKVILKFQSTMMKCFGSFWYLCMLFYRFFKASCFPIQMGIFWWNIYNWNIAITTFNASFYNKAKSTIILYIYCLYSSICK